MKIVIDSSELKIVEFEPTASDEVVHDFIQQCLNHNELTCWRVCFSGFDDDPRELIEIPEAREFAQRLIDLGLLIILELPIPQGAYMVQQDTPGLNGLGVHGIARCAGEVRRRGKRVNIGMNIDWASYFTDLLKPLKERSDTPASLIAGIERIIANQSKFDPLRGSSKLAADAVFNSKM